MSCKSAACKFKKQLENVSFLWEKKVYFSVDHLVYTVSACA